jgi:uncharacterized protein
VGTETEFFECIQLGDRSAIEKMLQDDPGLARFRNASGLSPLMLALYYRQPVIADLLRRCVSNLDVFEASALGDSERVRHLLQQDPDLTNATAVDGFQPLGLACFFGREQVVEVLLAGGAQVNNPSRNMQQVMPLHSAVASRQFKIARKLMAAGANVNATQADGFTPLHGAAQHGDRELVELLLAGGADRSAAAADGQTAEAIASAYGHTVIAQMLAPTAGRQEA